MTRLVGLVVSIGLADSLNPSTIAPALYLAAGERPRSRVAAFTVAVFAVYLAGGALVALGPGQLVLSLLPHPSRNARHIIQIVAGALMIVAAALVWRNRARLSERSLPRVHSGGRSTAVLGATITAVELPTAFPYFAAIAAIVGSGVGPARQIALLLLFNLCFVLPLGGIVLTLTVAGDKAGEVLTAIRRFLERRWPVVLATLLIVAGVFVIVLGATGAAGRGRGRFRRVLRHFHNTINP